jgi:alpha-1,2-mannosyltransferase
VRFTSRFPSSRAALWSAWLSWGALIVTIGALILFGSDHTVVSAYRDAAVQWFAGRDIYNNTGHGFLYLPSAAILFAPFAALPYAAAEIAWRVLTIGVFAVGVRRLSTCVGRGLSFDLFPLMTLAALPPALSCARNGQSTLIMTAMMMLAVVDLTETESSGPRRWRATLWLSLSLAFKPLSIVMILLVGALDRRMAWRLFVGVGLVLLFPFLTQTPHYVSAQYVMSLQMVRASSLCGMNELWAQPFSVLGLVGISVSESTQTLTRVAAGLLTLTLCWQAKRRHDSVRAVEYLFSFAVLYILLFNPRSENNTYAMLGPVIGLFAAPWIGNSRHRVAVTLLSLLLVALAAGDELVRALAPPGEHIWLKPSLAILFLAYLVCHLFGPQDDPRQPSIVERKLEFERPRRPVPVATATASREGALQP